MLLVQRPYLNILTGKSWYHKFKGSSPVEGSTGQDLGLEWWKVDLQRNYTIARIDLSFSKKYEGKKK